MCHYNVTVSGNLMLAAGTQMGSISIFNLSTRLKRHHVVNDLTVNRSLAGDVRGPSHRAASRPRSSLIVLLNRVQYPQLTGVSSIGLLEDRVFSTGQDDHLRIHNFQGDKVHHAFVSGTQGS